MDGLNGCPPSLGARKLRKLVLHTLDRCCLACRRQGGKAGRQQECSKIDLYWHLWGQNAAVGFCAVDTSIHLPQSPQQSLRCLASDVGRIAPEKPLEGRRCLGMRNGDALSTRGAQTQEDGLWVSLGQQRPPPQDLDKWIKRCFRQSKRGREGEILIQIRVVPFRRVNLAFLAGCNKLRQSFRTSMFNILGGTL